MRAGSSHAVTGNPMPITWSRLDEGCGNCGDSPTVRTAAYHAADAGSIPAPRSFVCITVRAR